MKMNSSPSKWNHYKRFINNKGDVKVPGYNPITGKSGHFTFSRKSTPESVRSNEKVALPEIKAI
jgi:hypothetical protein